VQDCNVDFFQNLGCVCGSVLYIFGVCQKLDHDELGATENARPDIARPSKLWGLTSRDWTTRHHIARVDIARLVSVFA